MGNRAKKIGERSKPSGYSKGGAPLFLSTSRSARFAPLFFFTLFPTKEPGSRFIKVTMMRMMMMMMIMMMALRLTSCKPNDGRAGEGSEW